MERFRIALQENNFISSSGTSRPTNQRCDSRIFFGVVDLTKLKGLSLKVCTAVCSRETIIEFRQNHQITQRARTNIRWGMFSVKQNKNYFPRRLLIFCQLSIMKRFSLLRSPRWFFVLCFIHLVTKQTRWHRKEYIISFCCFFGPGGSQRVVGLPDSMLKAPFLFSFLSFGGSWVGSWCRSLVSLRRDGLESWWATELVEGEVGDGLDSWRVSRRRSREGGIARQ